MRKLGLCLSGGGARGAYQIGALYALRDLGLYDQLSCFSGTSIGAANIAVLLSTSLEKSKDIWFHIPDEPLVKKHDTSLYERFKKDRFRAFDEGYYSMEKFDDMMLLHIDAEKLRQTEAYVTVANHEGNHTGVKELMVTSFSKFLKGEESATYIPLHTLDFEDAYHAVKASCSIPFIFGPVINQDVKSYDGGVYDNAPIQPLIDAGCDEIILINITMIPKTLLHKKKYSNVVIHEIQHVGYLGGILNFTNDHSEKLFKMGYDDTYKYFYKMKHAKHA